MNCIVCGGKLIRLGIRNGYEILKCQTCGLGETKFNNQANYSYYHRDNTYIKDTNQFKNIFLKRFYLISKFKNKGSILDIGSSTGTMLSIFKKNGWDVLGIEPSKTAAQYANSLGINTIIDFFENYQFKTKKFDVVILNHVLEHVEDPVIVVKKINNILRADGVVLIDVPNFSGIGSRLNNINWGYLCPNEHKWHFTKKSLFKLLELAGFRVIYNETRSGIWDYGNPLKEIFQSFAGLKKRFIKNILFCIPDYIVTKLGQGSSLTVIGIKK